MEIWIPALLNRRTYYHIDIRWNPRFKLSDPRDGILARFGAKERVYSDRFFRFHLFDQGFIRGKLDRKKGIQAIKTEKVKDGLGGSFDFISDA